jgi:hypothetical protein
MSLIIYIGHCENGKPPPIRLNDARGRDKGQLPLHAHERGYLLSNILALVLFSTHLMDFNIKKWDPHPLQNAGGGGKGSYQWILMEGDVK